jgi:hypothetical protein
MDDYKAPYTRRRGGRIMLFLIVAALILLVAVCTYTCGYRAPKVTREQVFRETARVPKNYLLAAARGAHDYGVLLNPADPGSTTTGSLAGYLLKSSLRQEGRTSLLPGSCRSPRTPSKAICGASTPSWT